ncbi:MAG: transglycosylase SLT domain-containing protein [Myxococcaceae bacterium]
MLRKVFHAMHRLSSGCGKLPLLAALLLLGTARVAAWVGPDEAPAPVIAAEPSGDKAIIDAVLARRAPDLGLTLRRQLTQAITEEATRAGYDPLLIVAIIDVESDFDEGAVSEKGARGLMQTKPSTLQFLAEQQGIHLTREETSADASLQVRLAIRYLRQLQDRFAGDLDFALMAYNAGPARIRQAIKEHELDTFRSYPGLVKHDYKRFREGQGLVGDWALAVRDAHEQH